ncbi:unnamed protein product [Ectocarpus sp. 6 AP-2014]
MRTGWLVIEEDAEDALEDETADRCVIPCHGSEVVVLDEAGVREVEGGIQAPPESAQLQMRANGGRCYTVMRSSRFTLVVEGLADAIDTRRKSGEALSMDTGSGEATPTRSGRPISNRRGQFSSSILFGQDGVSKDVLENISCRRCNNLCL